MPRMMLVAAPDDEVVEEETETEEVAAAEPVAPTGVMSRPEEFHALLIVEGVETGDDRIYAEGSVRWRDLPIPLTASDESPHGFGELMGKHVGWITRVVRQGNEVHGYGSYLPVELRDEQAGRFIAMIQSGDMRGLSAELDDVEMELVISAEDQQAEAELYGDEDGIPGTPDATEDLVIPLPQPLLRTTESRLMGACAVLMPAFQECFIEHTGALTAAAPGLLREAHASGVILAASAASLTASAPAITIPDVPPLSYFLNPGLDQVTPPTLSEDGRYYGHLAAHGTCHIGFKDCVTPPLSSSAYAYFMTGELLTSDGHRVAVGNITMDTGHAPLSANAKAAAAHYDNTGTVVVDVAVGEDAHGIWFSGALRSGVTPEQIRALMASDVSGDWRRIGGGLELVGILSVNVPGFMKPRMALRKDRPQGLAASGDQSLRDFALVASFASWPNAWVASAKPGCGCDDDAEAEAKRKAILRMAKQIGRDPDTRLAALRARVESVRG